MRGGNLKPICLASCFPLTVFIPSTRTHILYLFIFSLLLRERVSSRLGRVDKSSSSNSSFSIKCCSPFGLFITERSSSLTTHWKQPSTILLVKEWLVVKENSISSTGSFHFLSEPFKSATIFARRTRLYTWS